jgi:DNA-binding winged helix-turn-helix (wHTH) protein/Tol biopolymer transport system component
MPAEPSISRDRVFRFGPFELSEREGELRRSGVRIRLQEQPFRVLVELVANAGKVVSRENLRNELWPADTFVDFDVGLNSAIRKLRQALNDDADHPHYIETLAKRGYRFLAPISVISTAPSATTEEHDSRSKIDESSASRRKIRPRHLILSAIAIVASGFGIAWWKTPPAVPIVESVTQLTDDREVKSGRLVTDGSRVYFNEGTIGSIKIAQVGATGGPTSAIPTRLTYPRIAGLRRGGPALLVIAGPFEPVPRQNLWAIPLPAGEPRQLGTIGAWDADFLPDAGIVFARGNEVYVAGKDGSDPRKLVSMGDNKGTVLLAPTASPDGKRLTFTRYSDSIPSSLFEANSDGSGVRPMLSENHNSDVCCAQWSLDGKLLVFSKRNESSWDIYVLPLHNGFSRRIQEPVRLTNGPLSYSGMVPSPDGRQIFAIGTMNRGELVRYDAKSRQFVAFLSGTSAIHPTFSADGKWITYLSYPDHSLWRSHVDGSERLQLTYPPMQAAYPYISPDGKRIAFGTNLGEIYVVSIEGGEPKKILEKMGTVATWSPDGNLLAVAPCEGPATPPTVSIYDFRSGRLTSIPSSQGLIGAQWLTQETLIAGALNPFRLVSFDLKTQKWSDLVSGPVVGWNMSPDYKYLYYTTGGAAPEALRLRLADHKVETIASLKDIRQVADWWDGNTQVNVAQDGSVVFTRDTGTQEIYALTLK